MDQYEQHFQQLHREIEQLKRAFEEHVVMNGIDKSTPVFMSDDPLKNLGLTSLGDPVI